MSFTTPFRNETYVLKFYVKFYSLQEKVSSASTLSASTSESTLIPDYKRRHLKVDANARLLASTQRSTLIVEPKYEY
jgi:hypothetical protein